MMLNRLRYPELAPEGIATMRTTEHYLNATTALPAVLLELVRLRVSLTNGCTFCTGHHTHELQKHNEPASRIEAVRDWPGCDAFTPKERAALAWADAVTDLQSRHASDEDYAAVSIYFHEKDLVDLTLAIASINAWNRMSIAFSAEWDPSRVKPAAQIPTGTEPDAKQVAEPPTAEASAPEQPPPTTAQSPSQTTPAHEDAPVQDTGDDDGGKVAHD